MNSCTFNSLCCRQRKISKSSQLLTLTLFGLLVLFCTVCGRTTATRHHIDDTVDQFERGSGIGSEFETGIGGESGGGIEIGNGRLRSLNKRSFFDIQCKGVYDKGIFAKLDRVCNDCYNLYGEPQLHNLCSQKCFSTSYFIGCLDALTLSENEKEYQELILSINADNPFDDPIDSVEKPEPEPKSKSKSKHHGV